MVNNSFMEKIKVIQIKDGYRQWYKDKRPDLYSKYGKSILAIDGRTRKIVKVFKPTEITESINFCVTNHYIHQHCDSVFYGVTEIF